jgi:hypothetical protein
MPHNLPPYLGTWDELVQALLNNPFLGSGGHGRIPVTHPINTHSERADPEPNPWTPASALFVVAAGLKDIVSRLPEGTESPIGSAIISAADDWEDWYCGNGPRPGPHVMQTAGELLAFAGMLEAGSLRTNIVQEAGTLIQKSFGAVGVQPAQVTSIAS